MARGLRSLRPATTALRLGESCLCPIELTHLLGALAPLHRPLVCFRPPLAALGSSAAGIFRAARQRRAVVGILLELGDSPVRSFGSSLAAVAAGAEDAGYDLPLGLLAESSLLRANSPTGKAGAFVAEILDAGFPTPLLSVDPEGFDAALLVPAAEAAKERDLGWALTVAEAPGTEVSSLLTRLAELGAAPAAVRSGTLAPHSWPRHLAGVVPWAGSNGHEFAEQREEAVTAGLGMVDVPAEQAGARAERAEALAYFAADTALSAWDAEQTGPRVATALLARWQD